MAVGFKKKDLTRNWFKSRCDIDMETGCWIWKGEKDKSGYGLVTLKALGGKSKKVHRVMHALHIGKIPDGYEVDHVYAKGCRSRSCCFPKHLEAVTPEENKRRYHKSKYPDQKEGHCIYGHELTKENTFYRYGHKDKPSCKTCRDEGKDPEEVAKWIAKDKKRKQWSVMLGNRPTSYEAELNWKYSNGYL